MIIDRNQAAAATAVVFVLGIAGGAVLTALMVKTAGLVAIIAAAILTALCVGGAIASTTAWFATQDSHDQSAKAYFLKFREHIGIAVAGICAFVAHVILSAVVGGVTKGITDVIADKVKWAISGNPAKA